MSVNGPRHEVFVTAVRELGTVVRRATSCLVLLCGTGVWLGR
jgi:hypothetical protein